MFSNMPICKVEGFGIDLGFIKLFPIAGPEILLQQGSGPKPRIQFTQGLGMDGKTYGILAEIVDSDTVALSGFCGAHKFEPPIGCLKERQINRYYLTRGHLRWVPEVGSRIGEWSAAEAAQLPGSTL